MNPHTKISGKTTAFGVGVKHGMTLIEVIMAVVIIAIAFYTLIAVYATTSQRNVTVETINDKLYLAQEKIEEYLTLPIASIVSVNPTTIEAANFRDYKYRILVTMVATSDLTTVVASSPYKKVSVMVWGGQPTTVMGTVEVDTLAVGW
jgi:prepilin-type N-terminal cleavage/methylation domain-containing protein